MNIKVIFLQLLLSISLLGWAGCDGSQSDRNPVHTPLMVAASYNGLQFEKHYFEVAMPSCDSKKQEVPCARMLAEYPRAVSGPSNLQRFINDTISHYVRESLSAFTPPEETLLPSMDSIARRFIRDYESFVEQHEEYSFTWEVETRGEILFQNARVLSVALDNYSYTGGAHPNTFRYFLNFDLRNRQMLRLEDIVLDEDRLKILVEQAFRQYHQLEAGMDLNEAGFFWDQNFSFPASFAIKPEGLYLYYNNYEVAAYAVGATELLLPWEKLEGIVDRGRIF